MMYMRVNFKYNGKNIIVNHCIVPIYTENDSTSINSI